MNKATKEQQAAIDLADAGEDFILKAGPGSGKTTTAVGMIEALREKKRREDIFAITYTNAAAIELRRRVVPGINVSTIHALIYREIRFKPVAEEELGLLATFAGVDLEDFHKPTEALPRNTRRRVLVARAKMAAEKRIDFHGALMLFADMLATGELKFEGCSFIIDEVQDSGAAEWEIFELLSVSNQIILIGDPDQSIYEFRGAVPELMDREGMKTLYLSMNFRSADVIVQRSNRLAQSCQMVPDPMAPAGLAVVDLFDHQGDEFNAIQQAVANLKNTFNSVAVLTRRNQEASTLAAVLNVGIPVRGPKPRVRFDKVFELISIGETNVRNILRACPFPDYRDSLAEVLEETPVDQWILAVDEWSRRRDPTAVRSVYVGTVHSVKGQEFDAVVVAGLDTFEDTSEGRRILYVGMTRAKHYLRVVGSKEREGKRRNFPWLAAISY